MELFLDKSNLINNNFDSYLIIPPNFSSDKNININNNIISIKNNSYEFTNIFTSFNNESIIEILNYKIKIQNDSNFLFIKEENYFDIFNNFLQDSTFNQYYIKMIKFSLFEGNFGNMNINKKILNKEINLNIINEFDIWLYVNKEDNFLEKNFEIFSFEIIYLNSKTKSLFNFFIVNEDYENFLKILNKNKQKNIFYEKINFFLLFENNIKNQINKIPTLQIDILNNIEKYKNNVLNNKKTDEKNNNLLFNIYKDLVNFYSLEEINIINNNLNYDFLKNILNKFNFLNKEINKLLKQCKYEIEILKLINKKIENDFNIENFYLEFNNNFEDFNKNKNINKNNLFEITLNNNFNILNIKKEIKLNINYFNFEFISNKKINNNLNKNNFLIDKKYYFSILCQNKINYLDKIKKLENNLKEKELKIKNYSNNKNKIDEKINKYEELIKKYEDEIKNKENEILKLKNEKKIKFNNSIINNNINNNKININKNLNISYNINTFSIITNSKNSLISKEKEVNSFKQLIIKNKKIYEKEIKNYQIRNNELLKLITNLKSEIKDLKEDKIKFEKTIKTLRHKNSSNKKTDINYNNNKIILSNFNSKEKSNKTINNNILFEYYNNIPSSKKEMTKSFSLKNLNKKIFVKKIENKINKKILNISNPEIYDNNNTSLMLLNNIKKENKEIIKKLNSLNQRNYLIENSIKKLNISNNLIDNSSIISNQTFNNENIKKKLEKRLITSYKHYPLIKLTGKNNFSDFNVNNSYK